MLVALPMAPPSSSPRHLSRALASSAPSISQKFQSQTGTASARTHRLCRRPKLAIEPSEATALKPVLSRRRLSPLLSMPLLSISPATQSPLLRPGLSFASQIHIRCYFPLPTSQSSAVPPIQAPLPSYCRMPSRSFSFSCFEE